MIKVKLKKSNDIPVNIMITGHALYDDFGRDIVCAAVSSTVITSVNACLSIDGESLKYDTKNGINIYDIKGEFVTLKIINNMMDNLYSLEKAYPKNIQIEEESNDEVIGI